MSEVPLYRHVSGLSGVKTVESSLSLDTTSSTGVPRSKETPTPPGSP